MTTFRPLARIALAAMTLLCLVPASSARAALPPDRETAGSGAAGAATGMPTADLTGFADWQVITIGVICALVAVVATLLATRLVQSRSHHRPATV